LPFLYGESYSLTAVFMICGICAFTFAITAGISAILSITNPTKIQTCTFVSFDDAELATYSCEDGKPLEYVLTTKTFFDIVVKKKYNITCTWYRSAFFQYEIVHCTNPE